MADSATAESKRVVRSVYEAIAAGDVERFLSALHEEFRAELPPFLPWGGVHEGAAGFQAGVLPGVASAVNLSSLQVQSFYGEGERVFATVTARALKSGEEFTIAEDWTVRDGKVLHLRIFYFDPTPLLGPVAKAEDK